MYRIAGGSDEQTPTDSTTNPPTETNESTGAQSAPMDGGNDRGITLDPSQFANAITEGISKGIGAWLTGLGMTMPSTSTSATDGETSISAGSESEDKETETQIEVETNPTQIAPRRSRQRVDLGSLFRQRRNQ